MQKLEDYRIKEKYTRGSWNELRYYPQRKIFGVWLSIPDTSLVDYLMGFVKHFKIYEYALEYINERIEESDKRNQKYKTEYIYPADEKAKKAILDI